MRPSFAAARLAVFAVVAAFLLAAVTSGPDAELRTDAYVAVIGVLGLLEARRWLRFAAPADDSRVAPLARRRPRAPAPRPPLTLLELEGLVDGASHNARAVVVRFAPRLRDVARTRLAIRRGIDLDTEPNRAAAALGVEAWDVLQPVRGRLPSADEPGLTLEQLAAVVDAVEAL